ncbi:LacI family DNA-binding transcriptional regulator [Nonomuraea sp. NPDC050790]|uniref:LacI family DNA-binding transcriptional regulator n=1 Tax=Nonomuraea sp. NPDC050790 TaxID=3364371 RepID=UPI00378B842E
MARLADIAAQAGVSISTVSKVLNGRSDVSAETRARVQRLLDRHRYIQPGGSGGLVEFVVNELDSPWAVELIRGAEEVVQRAGMGLVVSAVHGRSKLARQWVDALARRGSLGAILVISELSPEQESALRKLDIPFAVVHPAADPGPDVPSVGATNWPGGYTATRHLIELGHRRIALIGGPPQRLSARARHDGYRAALEEAGIAYDEALVRHGDFEHELAYRHALDLLALPAPPTAIFAGSDHQSLGTYRALRERGLNVPADVSVVGFDDLPFADWVTPRLTTVRQPLSEMTAMAARMVLQLLAGEELETMRVELVTKLVIRESTGPA